MSPWVETTLEELRDRPWPPPDGKWYERRPKHLGDVGDADLQFRCRMYKRRTTDGEVHRRLEVTVADSVIFSYRNDEESWSDAQAMSQFVSMFTGALARALGEVE